MNKIKYYFRLFVGVATSISALSILVVIVYFYSDYELNVALNSNIDDYTIGFMWFAMIVFVMLSFVLISSSIKNLKLLQNDNKNI